MKHGVVLGVSIAGLCVLAYMRSVSLPLIADDYVQIQLARDYGPVDRWGSLAADPLYRCRATSLVLTYWTERWFGFDPFFFNLSSLLLHIVASGLVLALGHWKVVGWRVSSVAACFFAVYQGHQEAVIWYAALPELLVFLFALGSFLLWLVWTNGGGRLAYLASLACYVLALLSKESAACLAGLLVLAVLVERKDVKLRLAAMVPFAVLAVIYFGLAYADRAKHLHFNDGTFSLQAPVALVVLRSVGRMLWVWGGISLLAIAIWKAKRWCPLLAVAGCWMVITLLPYSFLTYMLHVPSRHTYFASAGLALIVGAGILAFRERYSSRPAIAGLALVMVLHQCGYLWTRKYRQFADRAAPTEQLVHFARGKQGPIFAECFPYAAEVAELAVRMRVGERALPVLINRGPSAVSGKTLNLCPSPLE